MGIIAGPSFTTEQGFVLDTLYLSVNFYRFITTTNHRIQFVFGVQAFKSHQDKEVGRQPINLSTNLSTIEGFVSQYDFYRKSLQGLAYDAIKARWLTEGYVLTDVFEPGQPSPTEYVYNSAGYNIDGYNADGYNVSGFNKAGYNADGYNSAGFNAAGYTAAGYNASGFNALGYNAGGFDITGFNSDGWNQAGFGRDGYNQQGLDIHGNPRPVSVRMMMGGTDLSGSRIDLSGSRINLSGSRINLSASRIDLSGSRIDLSGSRIDLSGSRT